MKKDNQPQKCFWFCSVSSGFLFIMPNGVVNFYDGHKTEPLIKEQYRSKTYYRINNTSKRIAQSTIKRKAQKCNIIL